VGHEFDRNLRAVAIYKKEVRFDDTHYDWCFRKLT